MKQISNYNLTQELFITLSTPLNKFLYNILKNSHDAEDIAADTFVKILELVYADGKIPDKPLCYAIARNLAIDYLRRKKKIDYNSQIIETMQIPDDVDVFEEVNISIAQKDVDNMIVQLPEVYANVFHLRFDSNMSFKDIGSVMGLSENNARVIYYRAKNRLKDIYLKKEGK